MTTTAIAFNNHAQQQPQQPHSSILTLYKRVDGAWSVSAPIARTRALLASQGVPPEPWEATFHAVVERRASIQRDSANKTGSRAALVPALLTALAVLRLPKTGNANGNDDDSGSGVFLFFLYLSGLPPLGVQFGHVVRWQATWLCESDSCQLIADWNQFVKNNKRHVMNHMVSWVNSFQTRQFLTLEAHGRRRTHVSIGG